MRFAAGVLIGFCLAAMFAPWGADRRAAGKTEVCESGSFPLGKKWHCTPQEKAALSSEG